MEIYKGGTLIERFKLEGKDIAKHMDRALNEHDADEVRVIHPAGERDVYRRKLRGRGWTKSPIRKASKPKRKIQAASRCVNRGK